MKSNREICWFFSEKEIKILRKSFISIVKKASGKCYYITIDQAARLASNLKSPKKEFDIC